MSSYMAKLALACAFISTPALAAPLHDGLPLAERATALSCPSSNQTTYTVGSSNFIIECGMDRPGNMGMVYTKTLELCISSCASTSGCVDVSWVSNGGGPCYMKSSIAAPSFSNSAIWGARLLSGTAGTTTKAASSTAPAASKTTTTITASVPAATGKRGAAYNHAAYATVLSGYPKVAWAYDWDSNTDGTIPTAFNYVPMLWGADATHTGAWPTNVAKAIAAGSDHLLAFNEPDLASQSNLLPATAAAAYKQYMQPYAGQAKLGSPAVTNGGPPSGLTWLSQFMGNCTGCTVDFVAIHWYDSATNIGYFQNYIQSAYTQFNKPLWITEFGASGTDAQISTFFQTVLPWLDSLSYVQRYSYFYVAPNYLLNSAGTGLSNYGVTYVST